MTNPSNPLEKKRYLDPEVWGEDSILISEHRYQTYEGEEFFVAYFKGYKGKLKRKTLVHNGAEYVETLTNKQLRKTPIYNQESIKHDSKRVYITQDEESTDIVTNFLARHDDEAPVISLYNNEFRDILRLDPSILQERDVYLWARKGEEGQAWSDLIAGHLTKSKVSMKILKVGFPKGSNAGYGPVETCLEGPLAFSICVEGAHELTLVREAEIQKEYSSIETVVPSLFVAKIKAELGSEKTGEIDNDYITLMNVVEQDPGFERLIKYDVATCSEAWDTKTYPVIDDLDNAVLRRLSQYRIKRIGKDVRRDIRKTLASNPENRFNSISNFFSDLSKEMETPPANPLQSIIDCFEFEDESNRHRYYELFDLWFKKASIHVFRAFGNIPYPNDIVPVLVGKQGIGKGRFSHWIACQEDKYAEVGSIDFESPDFIRMIVGKLIVELGEMQAYKRSDVEGIKIGISKAQDRYRKLYEEGVTTVPRVASFIGTVNEEQFLRDLTGNRRFFPVKIKRVNDRLFKTNLNKQLWLYYYVWAKEQPLDIDLTLKEESMEFFHHVQRSALDVGYSGHYIEDRVLEVEKEKITGPWGALIEFTTRELGEAMKDKFTSDYTFSRKLRYCMEMLGYEATIIRHNGEQKRGYVIKTNHPRIVERIKNLDSEGTPF